MGWLCVPKTDCTRREGKIDRQAEAGQKLGECKVITVYTVNKKYGNPIEKRKALKITDKTVTFENGRRENLSNDYRTHFDTLDAAVEYYELDCKVMRSMYIRNLQLLEQREQFFAKFVAEEKVSAQ